MKTGRRGRLDEVLERVRVGDAFAVELVEMLKANGAKTESIRS